MARYTSNPGYANDIRTTNLYWYRAYGYDANVLIGANQVFQGVLYPDLAYADGSDGFQNRELILGGYGFTIDAGGNPTGGTVTGIAQGDLNAQVLMFALDGISVSLVDIYAASFTPSNTDELALIAKAFASADTIQLSNQVDYFRAYAGNDTMYGYDGNDTLIGDAGADKLYGGNGNDKLLGGSEDDSLYGEAGADRMFGGAGNDTYYVENVGDRVYETASEASTDKTDLGGKEKVVSSISFTLSQFVEDLTLTGTGNSNGTGNAVANTILGNSGANTLKGLAGNDILKSGSGSDKLFGGAGKDTLTGGKGADIFVFDAAPASRDTITDFSRADGDKIHLSKAVFKGFAYTGTLHAEDFYAAAGATTARDATDRVIYDTTTGVIYYDADGLGGAAAVQVALLGTSNHPALAFGDLQIIA